MSSFFEFEVRKAHSYFSNLLREKGLHPEVKVEDEWLISRSGIAVHISDTEERMEYEVSTATQNA